MNIGDTFTINGVDLVVLDFVDNNPFVWAYNIEIISKFSNNSNNYRTSILKETMESWFNKTGIKAIEREVDLTTMNGWEGYGKIKVKIAPFTFDEYKRYSEIIKKYAKNWFWTATAWSNKGWGSDTVCFVISDRSAGYSYYGNGCGLAPIFILDSYFSNLL